LLFEALGTAPNTAIQGYLNDNMVSYRVESRIYAHYILETLPDAKIAVLYQNDDFGKDYLIGLREGLGDKADKLIVATQSYETTDPTVDSQIVALKASGANVLLTAAVHKFAAQGIRKVYDIGWKQILSSVANAVGSVMGPAGLEKGVGIISATYAKDPTDP
jgi:branched-chain amino acid transport system substrate-binding protein